MSKYVTLHNGNDAKLVVVAVSGDVECHNICVCEENGSFGAEFMYFTKQDLFDMLKLFEKQENK